MKRLSLAVLAWLLTFPMRATEVELPKVAHGPTTALARAERDGDQIVVLLRVVDTQIENHKAQGDDRHAAPVLSQELRPGEARHVMIDRLSPVEVPKRFRTIRVPATAFAIHRANGKIVFGDQLPDLLKEETPILLNFETWVDAFHLLTVRKETLILSTRRNVVFPPTASLPPLPVPLNAPQILPKPEVILPAR
jgi:hypothetical protein